MKAKIKRYVKRYVKDRNEMLAKRSVEALEAFLESHAEYYPEGFYDRFKSAPEEVKEATLHKMVCAVVTMPEEDRAASATWLATRGYHLLGGKK